MASGGGQRSDFGSWRSDAGWSLGMFLVGFVIAWGQRERLIVWLLEPFVRPWLPRVLVPGTLYPPAFSLFLTYLSLAIAGGFFAALPFAARLSCRMWPSVRAELSGFAFVLASYVAVSAGLLLAHHVVFPWVAVWIQERAESMEIRIGDPFNYLPNYVEPAVAGLVGLVLLLEIGVIAATLRIKTRSPPDSLLGQTPP